MLSEPKAFGIQPDSRLEDRSLRTTSAQRKRTEEDELVRVRVRQRGNIERAKEGEDRKRPDSESD